jgi:hypothetical protein
LSRDIQRPPGMRAPEHFVTDGHDRVDAIRERYRSVIEQIDDNLDTRVKTMDEPWPVIVG